MREQRRDGHMPLLRSRPRNVHLEAESKHADRNR
jgi:hypothetical protein